MMKSDFINNLMLGYLPYVALSVIFVGTVYRAVVRNNTIQATSSQFISKDKQLTWGSNLFHYAIIMVFFGHIFGLLTPEWTYNWFMSNETKRNIAIVMGSLTGGVSFLGLSILAYRRFTNKRVRATGRFQDDLIVVLLLVQILLGLWSTYITTQTPLSDYMAMEHWAQGVFILVPDSWKHIAHVDIIYKLHIINGFLIFIIFPFTKLMHMVALPLKYAIDFFRKK